MPRQRKTYEQRLADWRAKRDRHNAQARELGIPVDTPIRIKVQVGWTLLFGDTYRIWEAKLSADKHGWLLLRPLKRGGFRLPEVLLQPGEPKTWPAVRPEAVLRWEAIKP